MIRPAQIARRRGARRAAALLALAAASAAFGSTGFVTRVGLKFQLDGQPYYLAGANFWQGMNMGMSTANGGDRARLGRELDRLQAAGINSLRVLAASEGPNSEPYRVTPALQTSAGVYNEKVFRGLDRLLSDMSSRDMRAVMMLNNFWYWSGGMAQYVAWAKGVNNIPYPNDTHDWNAFENYAAVFYTNAVCQTNFQKFIRTLLNRTNTVTGIVYRNDPTILAWELANEPRRYPAAWIDDTAAFIKSLDTRHMVTTGSEGSFGAESYLAGWQQRDFVPTHDGPNIDYATCHIWPQNWGWYDPGDTNTYPAALSNALAYLEQHLSDAALALGKPLVLEESGLARDRAPPLDEYDPAAPTTHRDAFLAAMFLRIYDSARTNGAAGGDSFWAWAGESRPGSKWIGDPPHETAGWYSVYDIDVSTTNLLALHAFALRNLIWDANTNALPDSWEIHYFSSLTNPLGAPQADWDQDGADNLSEYIAGTDPTNRASLFRIQQLAPAHDALVLTWPSVTGRLYTVNSATNLSPSAWTNVLSFSDVPASTATSSFTNSSPGPGPRFYRIRVRLPP